MNAPADGTPAVPTVSPSGPDPLTVRFANTRYAVRGQTRDAIGTPELLDAWLTRHADELGLSGVFVSDADDVPAFVGLRDAVRDLIAVAIADAPDLSPALEEGVALLNRLSAGAPAWPTLVHSAGRFQVTRRTPRNARATALATLAQDAIRLLGGDLADDLRACRAPGCVQVFVKDRPRREWCSPACGNRARAARHYLRHRDT